MGNNELLKIVLAFILGFMCSWMIKQMCGGRLVEGFNLELKSVDDPIVCGEENGPKGDFEITSDDNTTATCSFAGNTINFSCIAGDYVGPRGREKFKVAGPGVLSINENKELVCNKPPKTDTPDPTRHLNNNNS